MYIFLLWYYKCCFVAFVLLLLLLLFYSVACVVIEYILATSLNKFSMFYLHLVELILWEKSVQGVILQVLLCYCHSFTVWLHLAIENVLFIKRFFQVSFSKFSMFIEILVILSDQICFTLINCFSVWCLCCWLTGIRCSDKQRSESDCYQQCWNICAVSWQSWRHGCDMQHCHCLAAGINPHLSLISLQCVDEFVL